MTTSPFSAWCARACRSLGLVAALAGAAPWAHAQLHTQALNSGWQFRLADAEAAAAHPEANIIFGAMLDENLEDEVWVTVVATGYEAARSSSVSAMPACMRARLASLWKASPSIIGWLSCSASDAATLDLPQPATPITTMGPPASPKPAQTQAQGRALPEPRPRWTSRWRPRPGTAGGGRHGRGLRRHLASSGPCWDSAISAVSKKCEGSWIQQGRIAGRSRRGSAILGALEQA